MSRAYPPGKLPADALARLLEGLPRRDPRLTVPPRPGEDAAVVDLGDRHLVVTTDPVTFAVERIGWYAVHVNANDIAVMGGRPRWFFCVLLLPERSTTPDLVRQIMADVVRTCDSLGVEVSGGHTEITIGLDRPIVVGQMIGEVEPGRLVRKSDLRVGDAVVLVRGVAIEGTALLARECRERLEGRVDDETLRRAAALLTDLGISVVDLAAIAMDEVPVRAMHDPTEGGVLTGVSELALAAGRGVRLIEERVYVLPETRAIARALDVDPLATLASGALLVGVAPADAHRLVDAFAARGIRADLVGEVLPAAEGLAIERGGERQPLLVPARDEVARVLETGV